MAGRTQARGNRDCGADAQPEDPYGYYEQDIQVLLPIDAFVHIRTRIVETVRSRPFGGRLRMVGRPTTLERWYDAPEKVGRPIDGYDNDHGRVHTTVVTLRLRRIPARLRAARRVYLTLLGDCVPLIEGVSTKNFCRSVSKLSIRERRSGELSYRWPHANGKGGVLVSERRKR